MFIELENRDNDINVVKKIIEMYNSIKNPGVMVNTMFSFLIQVVQLEGMNELQIGELSFVEGIYKLNRLLMTTCRYAFLFFVFAKKYKQVSY